MKAFWERERVMTILGGFATRHQLAAKQARRRNPPLRAGKLATFWCLALPRHTNAVAGLRHANSPRLRTTKLQGGKPHHCS